MRILLVAATDAEIAPIVANLAHRETRGPRTRAYRTDRHDVDVLIAGIGMVPTAVWTARALAVDRYDAAFNAGVCGSFDAALLPGTVVHVISDRFPEVGVEDGEALLTLEQVGLPAEVEAVGSRPPASAALDALPRVRGITVNTVHGCERSIENVRRRFNPQVETMEGAAFMYACSVAGVPFAQVRAVSNIVEPRNRASWKLSEAIDALGRTMGAIVFGR